MGSRMNAIVSSVNFTINGKEYYVSSSGGISTSKMLVGFIRDIALLKGTKTMCQEGGCGACVVTARLPNGDIKAINSCLTPVLSCNGWDIYTVEFLGNKKTGYHEIQRQMVYHSGTQCGFCSPGMVMNMYSMMEDKDQAITVADIEDGFDGNICRCTGYRSILDTMKSLATDAPNDLKIDDGTVSSIPVSDCHASKRSPATLGTQRTGSGGTWCGVVNTCYRTDGVIQDEDPRVHLKLSRGNEWVQPKNIVDLLAVMRGLLDKGQIFRLVAGNTGSGVYLPGKAQVTIDITALQLDKCGVDGNTVKIGGCTPLAKMTDFLRTLDTEQFLYADQMAKHLSRVANTPIRNRATPAGNLMLKYLHPEFPSDIFTILESIGTKIEIASINDINGSTTMPICDILDTNFSMKGKILTSLILPKLSAQEYRYHSYKISKRYQNAHAYVNAGFLFKLDYKFNVVERPKICFGGISKSFVHATNCEAFLTGKSLLSQEVLDEAFNALKQELSPSSGNAEGNPSFRKTLAKTLLYKTILSMVGDHAAPIMRSGAGSLVRNTSKGVQTFEQEAGDSPLYKPIRKIEAIHQTSGEAEYIADLPTLPNELFGAFLLSKVANATLKSIDASQALKLPGVVQFFQAKDIPGTNNYMEFGIYAGPPSTPAKKEQPLLSPTVVKMNEANKYALNRSISGKGGADIFKRLYELVKYSTPTLQIDVNENSNMTQPAVDTVFVQRQVSYYGQALGLLVATSKEVAYAALALIKVEYENVHKPKIGLEKLYLEAEKDGVLLSEHSASPEVQYHVKSDMPDSVDDRTTIRGSFKNGSQYHYHMELQSCLCIQREDCLDVYAGTQWMDHTQYVVASVLNIPHNKVNVQVRRLGGGFGAKLTRNAAVSAACALAAYHTGKPVRVALTMEENMTLIGKRTEYFTDYQVAVTNDGKIVSLDANIACGTGFTSTESDNAAFCIPFVQNAYACDGWKLTPLNFTSNTASSTSIRGPGSVNGVALIENIMDHIAFTLNKDPLNVRSVNYATKGDSYITSGKITDENKVPAMMEKILADANYLERRRTVDEFNSKNLWKKRGLSAIPVKFLIEYLGAKFTVFIAIYHFDGTVAVSHPGIEMGQGINTKVGQTVAHALGISIDFIQFKPSNNLTGANSFLSGASFTSELCSYGALKACEILKSRMAPYQDSTNPLSWVDLVKKCYTKHVDLAASYMQNPNDQVGSEPSVTETIQYPVWIVCAAEVEIDVLTGENRIVRVDILQDVGKSLSPHIDIGQIEGAFVMGLGFFTTEQIIHDETTGELLTTRSWNYKPPQTKCIPEDFRITILPNSPNPHGVLGSKATGEPSLVASFSVVLALKDAIYSARRDAGCLDWFRLDTPVTPEDIVRSCLVEGTRFTL